MKSVKYILLFLIIFGNSFFELLIAQPTPNDSLVKNDQYKNDPIVEVLDSLVMLNNIIRFNNINTSDNPSILLSENEVPYYSDEIYAQRISKLYSPIPLEYNDQVKRYIELYAYKRRSLTSRVMGLSNLYFPLFEEILDQHDLPLEFKYLSIVESALNPIAVSRVGATGIWQFMYNTGKMYDLKINSYYDERRDPVKATKAACQYFKDMYAIYHDWLLVIAAYNCGAGNVNKAIRRSGGSTNFWEISRFLPAETRGYVPAFIAVTYVMNYAGEHNIFPEQAAFNYIEIDTVAIDKKISLQKISNALNIPLEVVTYLNPVYKRGIIPSGETSNILRLPVTSIPDYLAQESTLFAPDADQLTASKVSGSNDPLPEGTYKIEYKKVKKYHTVRSGESLSVIAQKRNVRVSQLKKWNNISGTLIRSGQRLSYYTTIRVKVPLEAEVNVASSDKSESDKNASSQENELNSEFIYHQVVKGDTLWNIAKKYNGATVEQIVEINNISDKDELKPGTTLKVKING